LRRIELLSKHRLLALTPCTCILDSV